MPFWLYNWRLVTDLGLGGPLRPCQVDHEELAGADGLHRAPDPAPLPDGDLEHGVGAGGGLVGCRGLLGPLLVTLHQQVHDLVKGECDKNEYTLIIKEIMIHDYFEKIS